MNLSKNVEKSDAVLKCPCCLSERTSFFLCNAGKDKKYSQYQCCQCGFQYTYPCPSAEEIDRYYAGENYYSNDQTSDEPGKYQNYEDQIQHTLVFFHNWLKSFALPEKSTMLDIGCAKGIFMEAAKKDFNLECSGVELSDYARNYVTDHYNGIFPVWKSLNEMPVPADGFDLILLFDVIEHVNDPWSIFLGLFQRGCIGEKTRVLITTPNCVHHKALQDPGSWQYRYPPAHLSFYPPETLQKIGEMLLFRNVDIFGHSITDDKIENLDKMLQETYSLYDGLYCCFSGSSLGEISPDRFPASLQELQKSPQYLELLTNFITERNNSPFNPDFRKHLAASYDNVKAYKAYYEDIVPKYANLEAAWKAEVSRREDIAQKYAQLEDDLKTEVSRREDIAQKYAHLEEAWKTEVSRREDIAQKYARLEDDLKMAENLRRELENDYRESISVNKELISEIEETRKSSYEQWLKITELLVRVDQLTDSQTALTAYRDVLENQVRELDAYRCHLENQVRELDAYRCHLENQVRGFSEKLDEVYHSNSYRIGRLITWPVRKCKALFASLRQKAKSCSRLKKECGAAYILKCILRKLTGRKLYRSYDIVSSIGVNCEISFNLVRVNGSVESFPLIWSFVHTLKHLPELIQNPMRLADEQEMKHDYSCNMVLYPDIAISFHCKGHVDAILGPDGKVDEVKAQVERDELKSRLEYLAKKWQMCLSDPAQKMLCILTPWEDKSTTAEILAVFDALQKYPAVDLLVVLTGKEKSVSASRLKKKGVLVRYISHHPPHDKITVEKFNDLKGWNRICHEFRPQCQKSSNKVYKYEH